MIPKNWRVAKLQTVAEVQTGVAKGKTGIKDPITLPYLRVANVQDGYLDLSEIKKITISKEQIERYSLQYEDILLTEGGDFDKLGRGSIWHEQIQPCLHQNHIFVVRPNPNMLMPVFFSYQASSSYGKRYFLSCSKQTTNLASINSTQLKNFPVLLPPIDEQKKIAEILGTWDEAIGTIDTLIVAKQKLKRAHLKVLAELAVGTVSEFSCFVELRKSKFNPLENENVTCLELEHISQGTGQIIGNVASSEQSSTKNYFDSGDILFGKLRPYLRKFAAPEFTGVCSSEIWVLRASPKRCLGKYLFYLIQTEKFIAVANKSSGSKMPRADWDLVAAHPFTLPNLKEQKAAVNLLDAISNEINLLQLWKDFTAQQKQGLMQQLLTGKLSVKTGRSK
jgi:type I restriction enzyme, S subunit